MAATILRLSEIRSAADTLGTGADFAALSPLDQRRVALWILNNRNDGADYSATVNGILDNDPLFLSFIVENDAPPGFSISASNPLARALSNMSPLSLFIGVSALIAISSALVSRGRKQQ